jgi:cytochrome-b5 reductase
MSTVQGFLPYIISAAIAAGTVYFFANKKSKLMN